MVLIDDFSTSTADSFAAMMQDSGNAFIYGMRSNGAGGNNTSFDAGVYSEAIVGMTLALQSRPNYVAVGWLPHDALYRKRRRPAARRQGLYDEGESPRRRPDVS